MAEQPRGTRPNEILRKYNSKHDGKGRFASGGGGTVGGHGAGSLINNGDHVKPGGITGSVDGWSNPSVRAFISRFKPGKTVRSRVSGRHGVVHQANHTTGMIQMKDQYNRMTDIHAKELTIDGDYSWPKGS